MQRTFGVNLAPGVKLTEKDSGKAIIPASTGNVCFIGVTEKGNFDELIFTSDINDFREKCGNSLISETQYLPDSVADYYNNNNSNGQLMVIRVSDGHEEEGVLTVRSKHPSTYPMTEDATWVDFGEEVLFTIAAKNGGRWSGRFDYYHNRLAAAGDMLATTVDTKITMDKNKWKGGYIYICGSGESYYILSNTTAGVITVEPADNVTGDYVLSGSADLDYVLIMPDNVVDNKYNRSLCFMFEPGVLNKATYFGMKVYENEELKYSYPNLTLDSTDTDYFLENVINNDDNNYDFEVTAVSDKYAARYQASNRVYEVKSHSTNTITVEPFKIISYDVTNPLVNVEINPITWVGDEKMVYPCELLLTFTAAAAFTVTDTTGRYNDLPAGATGAPYDANVDGTLDGIPAFTVVADALYVLGDTITIRIDPLPWWIGNDDLTFSSSLDNFYVYSDRLQMTTKYLAKSVSFKKITFYNTLGTDIDEPQAAEYIGADLTGTFPITIVLGASDALLVGIPGTPAGVTGTVAAAAYANLTLLVAALNVAWVGGGGVGTPFSAYTTGGVECVKFTDPTSHLGKDSFLEIMTVASSCYTLIGFTVADPIYGDAGSIIQCAFPESMWGGEDGWHDSTTLETAYISKLGLSNNLLEQAKGEGLGLIKLACPGIIDTDILKSLISLGEHYSYPVRIDPVSTYTDENVVTNWCENTIGKSDFLRCAFPGWKIDVATIYPLTGEIMGTEARICKAYNGYHKAPAGVGAKLNGVKKLYPELPYLNEDILNSHGVQIIKKVQGNVVIWGGRQICIDSAWLWIHQRDWVSHLERGFLESFDWVIFEIPDKLTRQNILSSLSDYLYKEYVKGALVGDSFKDSCSITMNNKNEVYINFYLVDTLEQLKIFITKLGITEL